MNSELSDAQLHELRRLARSPHGVRAADGHHRRTLESLARKGYAEQRAEVVRHPDVSRYFVTVAGTERVRGGGTRSRSGRP